MTIFGDIIEGKVACDKVFENENLIVIKDKYPKAPVHLLIIPKQAIAKFHDLQREEMYLFAEMGMVAQQMAEQFGIADGYRLVINNGKEGGQCIFHLHMHLLGGKSLTEESIK